MSVVALGRTAPKREAELIKYKALADLPRAQKAFNTATELSRFYAFWDLMDTIKIHGYTRAAMSVIGRSTVGAWWTLARNPEFKKDATERKRKRLMSFYMMYERAWDNIKDYFSIAYKIMIAAMYLKYFGQAAFHIVRNNAGQAIGFDFLHGFVVPNVDDEGYFKEPAFMQFPTKDPNVKVVFENQRDIVFIVNPDWEGRPTGGSDTESLTNFTLPLDIYLQTAAREYMKNRDRPEVVYQLASDISDEGFDAFVSAIREKYSGPKNIGKSPVAIRGDLKVIELSKLPSDLPYQDARKDTRTETFAVTGVTGAKLGVMEDLSNANLRELRREFHETSMLPLFKMVEVALTEQIHVREFEVFGWEFKFRSPDFLTAVERATVHMRYHGMGAMNPNEVRSEIDLDPRERGDEFFQPKGGEKPGSPPEGREDDPAAPAEVGEPTLDDQDPPRGDNHDDESRSFLQDLRGWRSFAVGRAKKGRSFRPYNSEFIPEEIRGIIQRDLENTKGNVRQVHRIFEEAINLVEEQMVW
jgi:hypothetical protein